MVEQAVQKLREGLKSGKFDRRGNIMKDEVCRCLIGFCGQDREFAQAVVQGGSFEDCMKAVVRAVKGAGISDVKAFTEAAQFYFPGAGIDVRMTIDLCAGARGPGAAADTQAGSREGIMLSLADFL